MLSISNIVRYFNNLVESLYNLNDFTNDVKNTEIFITSKLFQNLESYLINDEILDQTILELTDSTNEEISGCNSSPKDEEYCYNEEIAYNRYLVPFKSMEKAVRMHQNNPNWSLKSLKKNNKYLKSWAQLKIWKGYVEKDGNNWHKLSELKNSVYNRFKKAREKYLPIHDRDLKRWAIQESRKINLQFNASKYWINKFKKDHRIVSRHVTRVVTSRKMNQRLNIQKSLEEFRVNVNNELKNYEKREVVNFDQMGINHEIYSKRTLSDCGEKETNEREF